MEHKRKILTVIESGIANLQKFEEITNDLNVFPVPDGDTGSNMLATVMGGWKNIDPNMDDDIEIINAFAKGCLLAARGNSGVITSQVIRGFAEGVTQSGGVRSDQVTLQKILKASRAQAYESVADPVEGTILTVVRYLDERYDRDAKTLVEAIEEVLKITNQAVEDTTSMLKPLADADVVDSGAYGLMRLIEGSLMAIKGKPLRIHSKASVNVEDPSNKGEFIKADANKNIGYCSEVIITLKDPEGFDKKEMQNYLGTIGDSIAMVDVDDILKIHVHTKTPYKLLQHTQKYGEFSKIKIENMSTQVDHNDAEAKRSSKKINPRQLGVVAISAGEGINNLFEEAGVDSIVFGGQSMNPSVEDITKAVESLPNKQVVIFPNNSNIIMTAQQVAETMDREIYVIPTKSIQQGLIALYNLSKEMTPFNDYKDSIESSFKNINEGSLTYAIRDTELDGIKIKKNQYISISDKKIIASEEKMIDSAKILFDKINVENIEEITVIHNDDISKEDLETIKKWLEESGKDFEIYYGGQEVYTLLIFGEE